MKHRDVGRIVSIIAMGMMCRAAHAENGGAGNEMRTDALEGAWEIGLARVAVSEVGGGESAYALRVAALELEIGSFFGGASVLDFDWSHGDEFVKDAADRDPWDEVYRLDLGVQRS